MILYFIVFLREKGIDLTQSYDSIVVIINWCHFAVWPISIKQQNDIHIIWLHNRIHDKMKTLSRMVRCSYKYHNENLYSTS